MNSNQQMRLAQRNKKDEFYTTRKDIEAELLLYKNQFSNSSVYCPCDSQTSEFTKFFERNYKKFGLMELLATEYYPELEHGLNIVINKHESKVAESDDNNDFRTSAVVAEFIQKCDFIVTNPPFSLFREFITMCIDSGKKFCILGNMNSILTKDIFKYIASGQLWWGQSIHSGDRSFMVPNDYPLESANYSVDLAGRKFIRVKGVRWFTNMIPVNGIVGCGWKPFKKFSEITPKYFDYMPDILCVDKTEDIPYDYDGIMGVPLTYFDKHNPDLFEIVDGVNRYLVLDTLGINETATQNKWHLLTVEGSVKYFRILIRRKK